MARIRTIKPEFFRHEGLQDIEAANPGRHVMLVFAGLWGHCDKHGRFEWKPRTLKLDILPFLNFDMAGTLEILRAGGFVRKYRGEDGRDYGEIDSFEKHQRISGKEAQESGKFPEPVEYDDVNNGEATGKHPESQERKGREKEKEQEGKGTESSVEQQAARPSVAQNARTVFAHWQKVMGHPRAVLDAKRQRLIEARLKDGYTVEDLCNAITGCSLSPYHMGQNEQGTRYDGIDLICRDGGKVDKFLATYRNPPRATGRQGLIEARNQSAVEEFLSQPTKAQGDIIDMEVGHG